MHDSTTLEAPPSDGAVSPLLATELPIAFAQLGAAELEANIRSLIAAAQQGLESIGADPSPPTYANTLGALETATGQLEYAVAIMHHVESVATSPQWRQAFNAAQPLASEFFSKIPLQEGLWRRLKAFAATAEASALQGAKPRLLKKTVDDFKRHGADLDAAGKQRLAAMDVELSNVTTTFMQNVIDASAAFELLITEEGKLAGLPESARQAARQSAASKGLEGWRFTLQGPSVTAVLTYLDDADIRQQLWRAFNRRAAAPPYDNRPLIERILQLRHQKAQLLGFANFAELVLADRMACHSAKAQQLLMSLRDASRGAFAAENAALQAFRKELEGDAAAALQPWDVGYYAEKQRQAQLNFDEEELRAYFPAEAVLQGLFDLAQRLFGIRVEPLAMPTWHPDVQTYALRDADGTMLAQFYVDIYPRETKRDGAWMNPLYTGAPRQPGGLPHVVLFCANATPPNGDQPALLLLREVETLFHEFGHLLHHALTEVPLRGLAGTQVAWDFVELPSQIMENWVWERPVLDLFARHHQTGASIPPELFERMQATRTFRAANAMMRQLGFSHLDLELHVRYALAPSGDVLDFARELLKDYVATPLPDDYAMLTSFSHLFADPVGYAAGYYSYKWAEVLEADAFSRFRREGILNRQTGDAYRKTILAQGNARPPEDLFRDFLGRDPRIEALLERDGLIAATT